MPTEIEPQTRTTAQFSFQHHPVYRKTLHWTRVLHTYVSMLGLILLLFFSTTGFMLNHDTWFTTEAHESKSEITLPRNILTSKDKLTIVEYLRSHAPVSGEVQPFDLPDENADKLQVTFKSPRGQSICDIELKDGKTALTIETQGLAFLLGNLHKAKDAGAAWKWILDTTAILLFFLSISGFLLWFSLPKRRMLGLLSFVVSIVLVAVFYFVFVP